MQPTNPAREIFEHALDLETAQERAAYVREACGADAALLARVEALLQANALAESVLPDQPPGGGPVAAATEGPGTVIGKYKLLEQIGEGGMGVVYLAEQQEPVRRQVALKIIKLGMDTRQVVARFEAERQALALMDHPNIAKVLDGGATEEANGRTGETASQRDGDSPLRPVADSPFRTPAGRPYFVMELVAGVPITAFCDQNQLSVEERIKLFIPVCQAVQHAHQKGIIHRDLKPTNVLVTLQDGVPVPKVIDFGVAKATNQKLTEKTLFTNVGTLIGTPAYMSPEQAEMSGLDVDTRSDVYSLGVLLYELLTGTQPFPEQRLRSVAYAEMQRIILQEEPERPSTRLSRTAIAAPAGARPLPRQGVASGGLARQQPRPTEPAAADDQSGASSMMTEADSRRWFPTREWVAQLRGDLDWIVMKCLEKDRSRRYETAKDLGADLEAYLKHTPIKARAPSAGYRLRKFVRRHQVASVAAVLIALAVIGAALVSTWALFRERAAGAQADERLRAALVFAEEVFAKVAPEIQQLAGAAKAQAKLGEVGLTFLQRLRSTARDDGGMRAALARLFLKLSTVQNTGDGNPTGDYETGLRYARQAEDLLGTSSIALAESERLYLLAHAKRNVNNCLCALGRIDEALTHLADQERLFEQLEHTPQYARQARRNRVGVRGDAGYQVTVAGDPARALHEFLLPTLQTEWARSITTNSLDYEIEVLMKGYGNTALAYIFLGDETAALPFIREALRWTDFLFRQFPHDARWAASRIDHYGRHGYIQVATGEITEGFTTLNQCAAWVEELVRLDPANDRFRGTRAHLLLMHAMAFAKWSESTDAPRADREERLARARAVLRDAQMRVGEAKAKQAELFSTRVQARVLAASEKLSADRQAHAED